LVLENDPANMQAAEIITRLKRQPASGFRAVLYIGLSVLIAGLLFFTALYQSDEPLALPSQSLLEQTEAVLMAAHGPRGAVIWRIAYSQSSQKNTIERNYQLAIINPLQKEITKLEAMASGISFMDSYWGHDIVQMAGKFYWFGRNRFEARDIYSGAIVENQEILQARFPELSEGIGQISHSLNWLQLTTRSGKVYHYHPELNRLYSAEEKRQIKYGHREYFGYLSTYEWHVTASADNRPDELLLLRKRQSPFGVNRFSTAPFRVHPYARTGRVNYELAGTEICRFDTETMFSPREIYADSNFIVLAYNTEIGANASTVYACAEAKTCKIKWLKKVAPTDRVPPLSILKANASRSDLQASFCNGKLLIYNPRYNMPESAEEVLAIALIDVESGKTEWSQLINPEEFFKMKHQKPSG
jgi:hypothetical protein